MTPTYHLRGFSYDQNTHPRPGYNRASLPILIKLLEQDRIIIEKAPFKFNRPYLEVVENAIKSVKKDLKVNRDHLKNPKDKGE